jgi:hypothetical protein
LIPRPYGHRRLWTSVFGPRRHYLVSRRLDCARWPPIRCGGWRAAGAAPLGPESTKRQLNLNFSRRGRLASPPNQYSVSAPSASAAMASRNSLSTWARRLVAVVAGERWRQCIALSSQVRPAAVWPSSTRCRLPDDEPYDNPGIVTESLRVARRYPLLLRCPFVILHCRAHGCNCMLAAR